MKWLRTPYVPGIRAHWVGYHGPDGPDICYIHRHKYDFKLHEPAKAYSYVLGWRGSHRYSETFTSLKAAKKYAEAQEAAKQAEEVD